MEKEMRDEYIKKIKEGIDKCPPTWKFKFKLLYRGDHEVSELHNVSINDIVDDIPDEKLDHALFQINNSLKKLQS